MFSLLSLFMKEFYDFDEIRSIVVLNSSSVLHYTTFDIYLVYILINKFSSTCTFDSTRVVQLVELRGINTENVT